ncbi:MAG TPA: dihydropyrimidinase [Acidimicrobiales bacterium]|nr:dihydropyrimidinase [Acidimicrobiales bacterium]
MLIRGGRVVDVAGDRRADVRTGPYGRVSEVAEQIAPVEGEEVYDATGKLVVPGGVDAHTHMQLPVGAVRVSDDFASGTRAAAVGGTTTIIDYVTVQRGQDPVEAVAQWRAWAEPSAVDWGLHLTFTEAVPEAVVAAGVEAGIPSFKLYLAYPDRLQVDDATVVRMMQAARRQGALVTLHCENGGAIEELRRQAVAEGRTAVIEHARTRPAILEGEATARAAALAELTGASVYVVHVSSANSLAAVREARRRGVDIRAETCPQYLYLDVSKLDGPGGADFVCTPPLRDPWHAEELWRGIAEGWVQTVATDHCPFWRADRRAGVFARPEGAMDFTELPGGLPGVETRMALVWAGTRAGRIGVADWARLCCEAPAKIFGLWPSKGSLMVGADADVVVWDPGRAQPLGAGDLDMAVDHSPYEGFVSHGWPELVLSRGRVVAKDGKFSGEAGWGRYLARAPGGPGGG